MENKFKEDIENCYVRASEKILNELREGTETDRNRFDMRVSEGFSYAKSESERVLAKYGKIVKDISNNDLQVIPAILSLEYHKIIAGLMEDYLSKATLLAQEKFGDG